MRIPRIYVDTSVLGGCFDDEFSPWSVGLMRDFRAGNFRPVLSEVVAAEVRFAPDVVQVTYAELLALGAEYLTVSDEALQLLATYRSRQVLTPQFGNDMLHIALATVADVDVLVSWNFRHIVRLDKIRLFNAVNIELGYKSLFIYSPREVTLDEGDHNQGR